LASWRLAVDPAKPERSFVDVLNVLREVDRKKRQDSGGGVERDRRKRRGEREEKEEGGERGERGGEREREREREGEREEKQEGREKGGREREEKLEAEAERGGGRGREDRRGERGAHSLYPHSVPGSLDTKIPPTSHPRRTQRQRLP
jgi:hypothetical protein